ncbi:MAG: sterol desaturase family protein [Sphingomonadaceae bacterium]|nr:sterol desaturase family protein [Sphingomonadaceae bacterium]
MAEDSPVKTLAAPKQGFWNRAHYLDRMDLRQLVAAYFQHYTIIAYLALAVASVVLWALYPATLVQTALCIAVATLAWPMVWYGLHRWVLHGSWMYKMPMFASTWKRIHYDHHQDPNHLEVLFGALRHTLPTVAIATAIPGWLIGGIGGAAAAFATGLVITCYNEFIHCIQHLAFKPRHPIVANMKARHLAHHFHHESGNYGIANFVWDRLMRTYYDRKDIKERSKTVFNLGYTPKVAERYPWVAELSGGVWEGHPRQRNR